MGLFLLGALGEGLSPTTIRAMRLPDNITISVEKKQNHVEMEIFAENTLENSFFLMSHDYYACDENEPVKKLAQSLAMH